LGTTGVVTTDFSAILFSRERYNQWLLSKKRSNLWVPKEGVTLDFHLDGYRFSDEFMVIPDLSSQLIIGAATMQKWRFKLDFEAEEVIIDPRVTRLRLLQFLSN